MRVFTHYTLAAATLAHIALSAIVAVPANEGSVVAVELSTDAAINNAVLARDDDSQHCEGYCPGASKFFASTSCLNMF